MINYNKLSKIPQIKTDFSFFAQSIYLPKKKKNRNVTNNIKYWQFCHSTRLWIASYNTLLTLRHTFCFTVL